MTVHAGLLRLSTAGDGDIIDLTEGVQAVVAQSGVDVGVACVFAPGATVGVTTMEFEPGAVADLQALLDRLVPREAGEAPQRPQRRHQRARPPAGGADRTVRDRARRQRPAGPRHLAADRARRLRRPAAGAAGDGPGPVLAATSLGMPARWCYLLCPAREQFA